MWEQSPTNCIHLLKERLLNETYLVRKNISHFELTNDEEVINNGTGSPGQINNALEGKRTNEGTGISNLLLSENGEQSEGANIANSEWT